MSAIFFVSLIIPDLCKSRFFIIFGRSFILEHAAKLQKICNTTKFISENMKSDDPFLSKSHIDYRFGLAVCVLLNDNIANSKGEIAEELGVKPAKFSEILNGRMHVGADMLAMLADSYLVNPDWLLTGRGENMFRDSSILPIRLEDGRIQEAHPYTTENEDEVYNARLEKAEAEEKKEAEEKSAPILLNLLAEKDTLLMSQAEEIGRLKERIAQLEQEKNVYAASCQTTPRELSTSTVDP